MAGDRPGARRGQPQRRRGSGAQQRKEQGRRAADRPARRDPPAAEGADNPGGAAPHNTSWDPVATWYTGWVGKEGSVYHRRSAVPTVLRLAAPQRGEALLDIGCGHGILAAPVLKRGCAYTGVDFSPRLVRAAKAQGPAGARFLHGDARVLTELPEVGEGGHDIAVFMLSIQDMDPLPVLIGQAAAALRPGGRLVIFMLHPAFRVPRGSGWGFDENRKLRFRRVDHYLKELAVPMKSFAEAGAPERRGTTWSFHRPLAAYFAALEDAGLVTERFEELPDPLEKEASGIPMFVALRARKVA